VNSRSDLHVLEKIKTNLLTLPVIKLQFNTKSRNLNGAAKLSLSSVGSTD